MAIIATYAEGHVDHGTIIHWSREPWVATKQYLNVSLAYIIFDLADDEEPFQILSIGSVTSYDFNDSPNTVTCDRVYKESLIECKKVEE